MPFPLRFIAAAAIAGMIATPVLSANSDQITARIAGYKDLGANFKKVNDGLRRGNLSANQARQLAAAIVESSRNQYRWFPRGSGPGASRRTAAKSQIWSNAREFRNAQNAFAQKARAFQKVAQSGDNSAMRSASRQLGASCKNCHDTFRNQDD